MYNFLPSKVKSITLYRHGWRVIPLVVWNSAGDPVQIAQAWATSECTDMLVLMATAIDKHLKKNGNNDWCWFENLEIGKDAVFADDVIPESNLPEQYVCPPAYRPFVESFVSGNPEIELLPQEKMGSVPTFFSDGGTAFACFARVVGWNHVGCKKHLGANNRVSSDRTCFDLANSLIWDEMSTLKAERLAEELLLLAGSTTNMSKEAKKWFKSTFVGPGVMKHTMAAHVVCFTASCKATSGIENIFGQWKRIAGRALKMGYLRDSTQFVLTQAENRMTMTQEKLQEWQNHGCFMNPTVVENAARKHKKKLGIKQLWDEELAKMGKPGLVVWSDACIIADTVSCVLENVLDSEYKTDHIICHVVETTGFLYTDSASNIHPSCCCPKYLNGKVPCVGIAMVLSNRSPPSSAGVTVLEWLRGGSVQVPEVLHNRWRTTLDPCIMIGTAYTGRIQAQVSATLDGFADNFLSQNDEPDVDESTLFERAQERLLELTAKFCGKVEEMIADRVSVRQLTIEISKLNSWMVLRDMDLNISTTSQVCICDFYNNKFKHQH